MTLIEPGIYSVCKLQSSKPQQSEMQAIQKLSVKQ